MTWTDDRTTLLRKLWADGLSASQIADELGGVTRNGVIGKVHRLGLAGRVPRRPGTRPRRPRPVRRAKWGGIAGPSAADLARSAEQHAAASAPLDAEAPEPRRLGLEQLNGATCRWPLGDPGQPDFAFCGLTCSGRYCLYHERVSHFGFRSQPAAALVQPSTVT